MLNLTNVEYTVKEANLIILNNFLLMLQRRELISDSTSKFDEIKDNLMANKSFKIKIDNNSEVYLYIINGKVTSITQNSPLDDFLGSNTNIKKFVIIKDPSKKTFKQVTESYPNSEIFFQHEFMEDIPSKDIIPKHTILSSEYKDELLQNIQIKNLKKIYTTDMMSRYYNAKIGDIFRIERHNVTSGKGVDYRVVVDGKLDLIF